MAQTALGMTVQEARKYKPGSLAPPAPGEELCKRAWEVARDAARLLQGQFQAQRVVAFGSLVHQEWFTAHSDIDLAFWGIAADKFYRAVAAVTALSRDFDINIVDAEACPRSLREHIDREGIEP